uniref:Protein V32-like protein n=1 Tax=Walrus alphaherpesvirus 1 TaxID=2717850 RepID=A0A7G1GXQ5_9ALPH|nr:protein V32-like protein [Walrus alphaherpesvirus 1]
MSSPTASVYSSEIDMDLREDQKTISTASVSDGNTLAADVANGQPNFEDIDLGDTPEVATSEDLKPKQSNIKPEICMNGMFVCHADPTCRACQELPFRRFTPTSYDSPHMSEALDIVNASWVKIPRVYSDTPIAPWMNNYIIPDLERENRE